MPWDQATWDFFGNEMRKMAAQSMQRDINDQMENGQRAGWPFPIFRNIWVVLVEGIPPFDEIETIWYDEPMREQLIDTLYGIYVGELRRTNIALIPEHSESVAFVHRNVRTSIKGHLYWLLGEYKKVEENKPQVWSGVIEVPVPGGHEIIEPGVTPGVAVGPAPTDEEEEDTGAVWGLPPTNGDISIPGFPGEEDEEPAPDEEPPGWPPPEWPPPPPPGGYPPEEEKPFPIGMVVAIGFGALALILLLKK